jgi:hypothetical protein
MTNSLEQLPNFVLDAYRLTPASSFVPEDTLLGSYTFLSWVRAGIGAIVTAPGGGGLRAQINVTLPVQADGQADLDVPQALEVRGPGDVIGIDERQVIRRYPTPHTTNAEDIFLAHVEFDRPELPWLFSPEAPAGNVLTPWLVLVVLADGRWTPRAGIPGLPTQVDTFLGELQPLGDATQWAHVQLIGPAITGPSIDDRLTTAYAPANLSRLICPRRLEPDRQYLACVVPYYDTGRQAALGTGNPGTLHAAWNRTPDGSDRDTAITLPIYTSWRFGIGPDGDFGSLANKLLGVPAPWQVGRRLTEMSTPGGGLRPLNPSDTGRIQIIHGPLVSPNAPRADSPDPKEVAAVAAENSRWPQSETDDLRTQLNRPADLAAKPADAAQPIPRPVVGPEIYARFQAAVSRVDPTRNADWFGELNLRPEHRVQAGLGTRVVQKDQEPLMQSAWAQVGEIDKVNRQLRWAQVARFVGAATHERHLKPLGFGDLLQVSRSVHSRLLAQPDLTVGAEVADSHLADAATQSVFRRVTRPLGGLTRFVAVQPADREAHARLVAEGDTARDMQRPYQELDGVLGVSEVAAHAVDAARLQGSLGVPPDQVPAKLMEIGATLAAQPAVADVFTPDRVANATPATSFSLVDGAGRQLLDLIRAGAPKDPIGDPVHAVASASIAASLAALGAGFSDEARQLSADLLHGIDAPPAQPTHQVLGLFQNASKPDWLRVSGGFVAIASDVVDVSWPLTPVRPPLAVGPPTLVAKLDPAVTITARIRARLGTFPSWLPLDWFNDLLVSPIMAAPVFTRPMYQALDAYSRDWLLTGSATFPQPDIVTVLTSNARFLEAFFAGLSHEMGRELLWRGYPTDQRGTYFRRFWSGTTDDLKQDLHRFSPTALGTHLDQSLDGRVVLMVRGELIKRYPDAAVLAMFAGDQDVDGVPIFEDPAKNPSQPKVLAPIQFHGHLDPDIVLVGFDLTVAEIQAGAVPLNPAAKPGWWFVIAEHPTAPRFGLGAPGADAASTAHVLLKDPVRAAFEGISLLTPIGAFRP